jgi:O-antigen/teichoic acid export membrane protein
VACIVLSPAVILALRAKGLLIVFMLVLFHHSLGAVTDAFNALLIARSRMKACTIVDVVIALALLIFTVISWLVGWKSALPYALAYAIAGILGTLLAYTNIRHYFRFEMPDQKHLENMLRQSLPFAIDAIVITAYFRLSVAGVYWLDSDASSALYATGQSFAFLIGMVPGRIALAALPRLVISAKKSAEALKQSVDRLWLYFIPMGAVIVGGAVLTCSWWLPLILGAKGKGAVIHCILIGLSRLPVFISTPATFALDAMMLQKLRVWISLFAGVLLAILGIPLTSHYGGVGMSIALLIVETIGAAAYVIMYLIKIQEWKPVQNDPGTGGKDLESISEKSCLLNEP